MTPDSTSIYVIGNKRLKKVGLAVSPGRRLRALQTGHGAVLSLLYACAVPIDIAANVERRAHWLLRQHAAHGEWFTAGLTEAKQAVNQALAERGEGEKVRCAVGRPALNVKPTLVRLPVEAVERIEALVGKNQMAAFIREAVERELKRRERQKPDS